MAEKFNPAPRDKHAADPQEALAADREMHEKLESGLEHTFPASDPVSPAVAEQGKHDSDREDSGRRDDSRDESLWDKVMAVFR